MLQRYESPLPRTRAAATLGIAGCAVNLHGFYFA